VNGGKVGILKEGDEVSLSGFLQCHHGRWLEAEIGLRGELAMMPKGNVKTHLEVLSDLTNKTLEGKLADEELSWFLIATNFAEGNSSRAETMRLLYATSDRLPKMYKFKSMSKK
jgi:hypothetical protein